MAEENMAKEIENVIEALHSGFKKDAEEKYGEWVAAIIESNKHLDIKNPEYFSLLTTISLGEMEDMLAQMALSDVKVDNRKALNQVRFVYQNYRFIDRHLDSIILKYEGHGCSSDKTRWLISGFVRYLITGEMPKIEEKGYWYPKNGSVEDWMAYIDSMYDLYYGEEEAYVKAKSKLVEDNKRIVAERYKKLSQKFNNDARFVSSEVDDDEKETFEFYDEDTGNKGAIILSNVASFSYRFYIAEEQRYAKWKDTLPEWFNTLLSAGGE